MAFHPTHNQVTDYIKVTKHANGAKAKKYTEFASRAATRHPTSNKKDVMNLVERLYQGDELRNTPMAVDANGIYIIDSLGNEYIDCASGTFDQPLGHRHPAIIQAINEQMSSLPYVSSFFLSEQLLRLADKLVALAPPNLTNVHLRDISGSTAVEGAIKIAQVATGKRDVISLFGSHHGQTALTTDISGNAFRRQLYPGHYASALHVPAPHCWRCFYGQDPDVCDMFCAKKIDDFIEYASSGSVAAFLVEPIQGNGGNIMPRRDWLVRLRQICDKHGILLIFDEIQTGIGRTGHMFAADYFGVQPHIMVLGKGLGGPLPRAAILVEKQLAKMPRIQHSTTGGSTLLSVASALATLKVIEQPGFLSSVRRVGSQIKDGLEALRQRFSFVGDVRGIGLMLGFEIVDSDGQPDIARCKKILSLAGEEGLVLRSSRYGYGSVIKIRPPLIITSPQADELLNRLRRLLERCE